MKKRYVWIVVSVCLVFGYFAFKSGLFGFSQSKNLKILYPYNETVFPKDMAPPAFAWEDDDIPEKNWQITLKTDQSKIIFKTEVSEKFWRPPTEVWDSIIGSRNGNNYVVTIRKKTFLSNVQASRTFSISNDPVDASIFYRSVPLPFKFARENMKKIKWCFGDVGSESKPHVVLENLPVCANCHSFSNDGKTIAMDVDAIDDKGAYVISSFENNTNFASDSIMTWSKFQPGKFTYGLLSQISPDGRYVVSTLNDCEIFVDRKDLEYSQLFFPFKGILVVYDRKEKRYSELYGANDTMFVHSNPTWTPDGKNILFTRAKAKHYNESGIHNGSVPKSQDLSRYQKFENSYLTRDSLFKFDIYIIPFNNGKGGKAEPIEGASNNGLSNYFPKVSPDGKWLMFCQAESFMLLQKDSKLAIVPLSGGKTRILKCNSENMNSWHSWSPNSKWVVYSSKALGPYTQLFLTHINADGTDTPPVYLDKFSFPQYANNIPEFVNTKYDQNSIIDPTFLSSDDFLIRKGEIMKNEGDGQSAFNVFNTAIEKFPNNPEGYFKRGKIFFQFNKFAEALKDLNKAIELGNNIDYFVTRGIIKIKMGDSKSAVEDLNKALEIDSTDTNANAYMGIAYSHMEENDLAIHYLKAATRLNGEDYNSQYYLGLSYFDENKFKEAEQAFSSGIKNCKEPSLFPLMHEMRGNTLVKLGYLEQAIQDFDASIRYAPNDPSSYYEKGKILFKLRREREGESCLRQAAQLGSQKAAIFLNSPNK